MTKKSHIFRFPLRNPLSILLGLVALCCFNACSKPEKGKLPQPLIIGRSVHGRPITAYTFGNGRDKILIGATIHGNEWAGTPIVMRLMDFLRENPAMLNGKSVSIIPEINPDGYAFNTRGNAHGVDLNRNFPAENRENSKRYGMKAFSEPESLALYNYIEETSPTRIVIMHQPFNQMDWDGPGQPLARHMAKHTIMPEKRVGARPGSMGSHYGVDKNLAIITYELPRYAERETTNSLWNKYGRALVACISWPNDVAMSEFAPDRSRGLLAPIAILAVASAAIAAGLWVQRRRQT